jgi:hypothetical protein
LNVYLSHRQLSIYFLAPPRLLCDTMEVEALKDHEGDSEMSEEASTSLSPAPSGLVPTGPILRYGDRLAFTYFAAPTPQPQQLNRPESDVFWLTVDHQLVYLSFFADTGPVSILHCTDELLHQHN